MSTDIARHLMVDFTQMKTFAEDPLVLEHGEGIRVTDDRGRTYIDGLSGVFTSNLGHGNPEIVDAVASQARRLPGISSRAIRRQSIAPRGPQGSAMCGTGRRNSSRTRRA